MTSNSYKMPKAIDYKKVCFKLADKLNEFWRKKYNKSDAQCKYVFEFLPASSVYLYASGLVAQITYESPVGFMYVVTSKLGGLLCDGCNTPDEAFKSMIDNYLELVEENCLFFGSEPQDYPKTIDEIMS